MLAISLGFSGMFLIVRVGAEGFDVHTYYALIAVIFVTLRDLVARGRSPDVPPLTVAFSNTLLIKIYSTVAMFWVNLGSIDGENILPLSETSFFISWACLLSILLMLTGDVLSSRCFATPALFGRF